MCPSTARFLYLLYSLLVLWRGSEATTSSSLECSLPGLCQGVLLEQSSSTSLDNCILFGRSTPGATWVTFNREHNTCWVFQACDQLDASVPDRVSSDVNCTLCSVTGACQGVLLIDYYTQSAEDCLDLCVAEEGCDWYEDWLSGEAACSSATTPTPSPSTPSTTPTTPAPTTTSTPAPAEDQEIVWIDYFNGAVKLGKFYSQIFNNIRHFL